MLPANNQSFQKSKLTGFIPDKTSRLAGVSKFHFNCRVWDDDPHRTTARVMPDEFGNCFARLDGEGMLGLSPSRRLTQNGTRNSPNGSPAPVDFHMITHQMPNNQMITGGLGAALACNVTVPAGSAVSFRWQFASSLMDPDDNEYAGMAGVRFLRADGSEAGRRIFMTSHDLPFYHSRNLMQTDDWRMTRFANESGNNFTGTIEWFVCSGHFHDANQNFSPAKAAAFPCCLLIDHITES